MTEPDSKTSETSTKEEALVESQAPASSSETVDSEPVPVVAPAAESVAEPVAESVAASVAESVAVAATVTVTADTTTLGTEAGGESLVGDGAGPTLTTKALAAGTRFGIRLMSP